MELTVAVPSLITLFGIVLTLSLSWVMHHQTIGKGESVKIRTELRDCKDNCDRLELKATRMEERADRLAAESRDCIANQIAQAARYEETLENLRSENRSLSRALLVAKGILNEE